MNIRTKLQKENPDVKLLFMTEKEYDKAIIGVGTHKDHYTHKKVKAVFYSREKVIKANLKMGLDYEWFSYNQEGAYVGEQTPVFV